MSKDNIRRAMNQCQTEINGLNAEIRELEVQYGAVEEFEANCNMEIQKFDMMMSRRRANLAGLSGILSKVKAAAGYSDMMSDYLNGSEFNTAAAQIDGIQSDISTAKRDLMAQMESVRQRINSLSSRLNSLQYDYNNYKEDK